MGSEFSPSMTRGASADLPLCWAPKRLLECGCLSARLLARAPKTERPDRDWPEFLSGPDICMGDLPVLQLTNRFAELVTVPTRDGGAAPFVSISGERDYGEPTTALRMMIKNIITPILIS